MSRVWSTRGSIVGIAVAFVLFWTVSSSVIADEQINTADYPGTFEQSGPSITARATGDFVAAWCDQRSGVPIAYMQRYSAGGVPVGANSIVDESSLYTYGNWWVGAPEIAENSTGVTAVVAPTKNPDMAKHVALWIFDENGSRAAGPIQVSDLASGGGDFEPFDASVAINDAGQMCVAWQEYRTHDLYARWFDAGGSPVTDVVLLTPEIDGGDSVRVSAPVSVVINGDGRAIVSASGSVNLNSSALAWLLDYGSTGYQRVMVDEQTMYGADSVYFISTPQIALLPDGSFAATVYRQLAQVFIGGYSIFATENVVHTFSPDGSPAGSPTQLFSTSTAAEYRLPVYDLAVVDNAFLFVGYSTVDSTVYGQRVGPDGSLVGGVLTFDLGTDSRAATELRAADLDNGTVALCWNGIGEDSRGNILVKVFDTATGQEVVPAQRTHDDLGSNQFTPSLAAGPLNTALAVWLDDRTGPRQGVWARWITSSGTPLGEPFQVSQQAGFWIRDVQVAGNGTGAAVVVWTAWNNASYVPEKIYCQRFAGPAFTPVGDNFIVSDAAHNSSDFDADVAMAPDNSFVVAYRGTNIDSFSPRPYNVYVRRFSAAGAPLTGAIKVNTDGDEEVYDDFQTEMSPSMVMRADGSFGVAWSEGVSSIADPGIYPVLQLYSASAVPIGGNVIASTSPYVSISRPYVAVNAANQFAIGFTGKNGSTSSFNMNGPWVQVIDSVGTPISDPIKMNIGEQDAGPSGAFVAAGPDGNFVVVYQVPRYGDVQWTFDDWDIWACRFAPDGQILGTRRVINSDDSGEDQLDPAIIMIGDGALVAWQDHRNTPVTDIFARFVPWDQLTAPYGDIDLSGDANIGDLTFFVDWLFRGGLPPMEPTTADLNGDGTINVGDITALVEYLF